MSDINSPSGDTIRTPTTSSSSYQQQAASLVSSMTSAVGQRLASLPRQSTIDQAVSFFQNGANKQDGSVEDGEERSRGILHDKLMESNLELRKHIEGVVAGSYSQIPDQLQNMMTNYNGIQNSLQGSVVSLQQASKDTDSIIAGLQKLSETNVKFPT